MTGLTPELALDYVRELSADVRAAIVLDAAGALLAGPAELAEPARALLAAGGDAAELEAADEQGVVCAVRTDAHAAVAVCGRFAIPGVVREDLRTALAALEGRAPGSGAAEHDRGAPADPAVPLDRGARAALDPAAVPESADSPDPGARSDAALLHAASALIAAVRAWFPGVTA